MRRKWTGVHTYLHDWPAVAQLVFGHIPTGTIAKRTFDWRTDTRVTDEYISVTPTLVIEGIPAMFRPEIREYLDLKILIDCTQEVANNHGKKRDGQEYKADYEELWNTSWIPGETEYYTNNRSDRCADVRFNNC